MCSCEGSFVCKRCEGAPFDPYYWLTEPEPVSVEEFEQLSREGFTSWEGWK